MSGFEDELTAAEGDGLSVGADVFDSSDVDLVRLHVVGNQYNRLLRQQQDSKALSASKGTNVTANRGKGENRRPHHKCDGNCFNCGKKGHRAGDCRSAKKSETSGAADDKKMAVAGVGATSAGVRSTLRTGTMVCARALSTGCETVGSVEM